MSSVQVMTAGSPLVPYYSTGLRARFKVDALRKPLRTPPAEVECTDYTYAVNEQRYQARSAKRLAAGGLPTTVPSGFPQRLDGPLVWKGEDFSDRECEYVYQLSVEDVGEINAALKSFKKLGLNNNQVQSDNFPLPMLAERLHTVCGDIYDGKGLAIIRGLDPDAYSDDDFAIVYLGITSYVGERRGKQDQRGSMLMHVMRRFQEDETQKKDDYNADMPFHTDTVCDCLCLVTKSCSAQGGQSILASGYSVYNELAATRPDLIHTLAAADWPFDTYNRDPPYYRRAIMFFDSGKLIINVSRRLLLGHPPFHPRSPGIPNVTEAQAEALDAIHFISQKLELRTTMQKGDIRLINNMALLHRREAFVDDGAKNTRHLVRLWLHNELMCWKLPTPLRLAWARVFEDRERKEHWDVAPIKKDGVVLRIAGSCD